MSAGGRVREGCGRPAVVQADRLHTRTSHGHIATPRSLCHASPLLLTSPARVCLPWLHGYKSGSCSYAQPAEPETSSDRHSGTRVARAPAPLPQGFSGALLVGAALTMRLPPFHALGDAADAGDEMPAGEEKSSQGGKLSVPKASSSAPDLTASSVSVFNLPKRTLCTSMNTERKHEAELLQRKIMTVMMREAGAPQRRF